MTLYGKLCICCGVKKLNVHELSFGTGSLVVEYFINSVDIRLPICMVCMFLEQWYFIQD